MLECANSKKGKVQHDNNTLTTIKCFLPILDKYFSFDVAQVCPQFEYLAAGENSVLFTPVKQTPAHNLPIERLHILTK